MKVTFDNVYNAFQIIAPKGTMISFTGEPTALADGVYLVGDDGIINLDEQFLTDTLYLSTEGTDYAVTGGMRVTYPLGDETLIIRAGSSAIPFSKGGKGGGSGSGTTKYKGTTTTPISNGSTTNPIVIDGEDYTAVFGDIAVYNYTEFVFDGTTWSEFGRPFDTTPTSGSANAVTSDGIYRFTNPFRTVWRNGTGTTSVIGGAVEYNTASGARSLAWGDGAKATGVDAIAMGKVVTASGVESLALGVSTVAGQPQMIACGRYNLNLTNDLLEIGNGTSNNARSNIIEVNSTKLNVNGDIKKNNVSLPTPYTTMPNITADMLGQIAMYVGETTSDYVKGYFYIASSDGAAEPTYSWVSMVDDAPTSGSKKFVTSDGIYKVTPWGRQTSGTGTYLGTSASAAGGTSVAVGYHSASRGKSSLALGYYAETGSSAHYSASIGRYTNASQQDMTAIGKYNSPRTGDLFNVGNGIENARSNIVEVNSTEMNVNGSIMRDGVGIDDYTTTERKIGKWIDGSDLYQRTFEVTGLVNGQWNNSVLGTSGINIVDVPSGIIYWLYNNVLNTISSINSYRDSTEFSTTNINATADDINILPKIGGSGYTIDKAIITIKYTKPSVQANLMQTAPTEEVSETPTTVEEDDMR